MKIYLTTNRNTYNAIGEYNPKTKVVTVLKDSKVKDKISESTTFKFGKKNTNLRNTVVKDGILVKNTTFKSLSSAASFITGRSCNGLRSWKTKDGKYIGDVI